MSSVARLARRMARVGLETISAVRPRHWDALRLSLASPPSPVKIDVRRAGAAIEWIKRAQDATRTGGVSWGYRARSPVRSGERLGWQPAYPETTGYIIETLLRFDSLFDDPDAVERARRMADWEVSIQLDDGGFQGGMIGAEPVESTIASPECSRSQGACSCAIDGAQQSIVEINGCGDPTQIQAAYSRSSNGCGFPGSVPE